VASWMAAVYGSDAVLDSKQRALLSSVTSPWSDVAGPGARYGLGTVLLARDYWNQNWFSLSNPGPSRGYFGDADGYVTAAFYFPDHQTAVVAIVNAGGASEDGWLAVGFIEGAAVTALFP